MGGIGKTVGLISILSLLISIISLAVMVRISKKQKRDSEVVGIYLQFSIDMCHLSSALSTVISLAPMVTTTGERAKYVENAMSDQNKIMGYALARLREKLDKFGETVEVEDIDELLDKITKSSGTDESIQDTQRENR